MSIHYDSIFYNENENANSGNTNARVKERMSPTALAYITRLKQHVQHNPNIDIYFFGSVTNFTFFENSSDVDCCIVYPDEHAKNKVVQFTYGDDGFDPVKVEFQSIPTVSMNIQEIYEHFSIMQSPALSKIFVKSVYGKFKKQVIEFAAKSKLYTDLMIHSRKDIIQKVFNNKGESVVKSPVAFAHIINGVQGQQHINASSMVDITPLDAYIMIEKTFANLEKIRCAPPNRLFKILYYYYLSPRDLLLVKRFNLKALTLLLDTIVLSYKRAIVAPGEMVGILAAQSIGEPITQLVLKSYHFSGGANNMSAITNSQLPSSLIGPAGLNGLNKAYADIAGLSDQQGGRRRRSKRTKKHGKKHGKKHNKRSKKGGKRSKKHSKRSKKHGRTRRHKRGGSHELEFAPFPSKGMLLPGSQYGPAGLNPEWKSAVEFDSAMQRSAM